MLGNYRACLYVRCVNLKVLDCVDVEAGRNNVSGFGWFDGCVGVWFGSPAEICVRLYARPYVPLELACRYTHITLGVSLPVRPSPCLPFSRVETPHSLLSSIFYLFTFSATLYLS
jgi:hypothetical protein